jgi:hypothetical protein
MACRQIITHSFAQDRTIRRFLRTSAIAKTWFQFEKAVKQWHGPDAMVKGGKEAIRAD